MQMFSSRDAFDNDFCPVRDELLGEMYRANENGLPHLVESISSDVRAMLALFCYRRSHLYSLALVIAATCSERELVELESTTEPMEVNTVTNVGKQSRIDFWR